jgi:hypothetical protein
MKFQQATLKEVITLKRQLRMPTTQDRRMWMNSVSKIENAVWNVKKSDLKKKRTIQNNRDIFLFPCE